MTEYCFNSVWGCLGRPKYDPATKQSSLRRIADGTSTFHEVPATKGPAFGLGDADKSSKDIREGALICKAGLEADFVQVQGTLSQQLFGSLKAPLQYVLMRAVPADCLNSFAK
jgi:hypothetical protein